MEESEKKSNGALFGSIVIVIILILGGIFIFYSKIQEIKKQQNQNVNQNLSSTQTIK